MSVVSQAMLQNSQYCICCWWGVLAVYGYASRRLTVAFECLCTVSSTNRYIQQRNCIVLPTKNLGAVNLLRPPSWQDSRAGARKHTVSQQWSPQRAPATQYWATTNHCQSCSEKTAEVCEISPTCISKGMSLSKLAHGSCRYVCQRFECMHDWVLQPCICL